MKKYLLISLITLCILSCKKGEEATDETTNDDNPIVNACGATTLNQLPWAKALISGNAPCTIYAGTKLVMYDYNGEKVFLFINPASSVAMCNGGVYNCSGVKIIPLSGNATAWENFAANRTNEKVLWSKNEVAFR